MPDEKIFLGFDYGLKHIGVAVGQTLTRTAQALTSVRAHDGVADWNEIEKLIATWKPHALIVGNPLNMDGTPQWLTHKAQMFAKQLQQRYHLPVHLVDERLSTVEARAALFAAGGYKALQKKAIDSLSAKLILENWLGSVYNSLD